MQMRICGLGQACRVYPAVVTMGPCTHGLLRPGPGVHLGCRHVHRK